ncbi:MAG: PRC-barrel domain-containing protein [Parvularcula sp.]|jgi:hypothetical protein|nr:PRC-barrel domain-containing protein [Parvularcula sp.]
MTRFMMTAGFAAIAAATPALAQNTTDDTNDACLALFAWADDNPRYEVEEMPELIEVVEENNATLCRRTLRQLQRTENSTATRTTTDEQRGTQEQTREMDREERQERMRDRDTEERTVRERTTEREEVEADVERRTQRKSLTLEQTVVVAGTVDVASPPPEVTVRQSPAQVQVRQSQPEISVSSAAPQIVVKERPAVVRVGMPTITIEQPAPIIEVSMPDPDVRVANAEPRVTVRQAPPRVSVNVPEPEVDLDLAAAPEANGGEVVTNVRRMPAEARERRGFAMVENEDETAEALVYVSEADAEVEQLDDDSTAKLSVQSQEPNVRFERAVARVEMDGEPKVEFKQVGEPRVTFVRSGGGGQEVTVGRLIDMEVRSRNDEKIGEIERVVSLSGNTYAVLTHGGFFGVGEKEIPIPLSNLTARGNYLIADNLTKEEVESLSDRELPSDLALAEDEPLRVRREGPGDR